MSSARDMIRLMWRLACVSTHPLRARPERVVEDWCTFVPIPMCVHEGGDVYLQGAAVADSILTLADGLENHCASSVDAVRSVRHLGERMAVLVMEIRDREQAAE